MLNEICEAAQAQLPDLSGLRLDQTQKENLTLWLNKLSLTADWENEEAREALCRRILQFLLLAQNNASFHEIFLRTLEDAPRTCGDRVALSIIDLAVEQAIQEVVAKNNLQLLSQFLIQRVWPIQQLRKIAFDKIPSLGLFDEIEVHLGYLVHVGKNMLNLDLGVEEMLYFTCSSLSDADISEAYDQVQAALQDRGQQAEFLASNSHWVKMLEGTRPDDFNLAWKEDALLPDLIPLAMAYTQNTQNEDTES